MAGAPSWVASPSASERGRSSEGARACGASATGGELDTRVGPSTNIDGSSGVCATTPPMGITLVDTSSWGLAATSAAITSARSSRKRRASASKARASSTAST